MTMISPIIIPKIGVVTARPPGAPSETRTKRTRIMTTETKRSKRRRLQSQFENRDGGRRWETWRRRKKKNRYRSRTGGGTVYLEMSWPLLLPRHPLQRTTLPSEIESHDETVCLVAFPSRLIATTATTMTTNRATTARSNSQPRNNAAAAVSLAPPRQIPKHPSPARRYIRPKSQKTFTNMSIKNVWHVGWNPFIETCCWIRWHRVWRQTCPSVVHRVDAIITAMSGRACPCKSYTLR
mmetsp:Transcript_67739/g.102132  ORF Transcript_67739/g.102132 Transcript_67739/m.102132 type:complete len:238 (+) Transcript_67739:77-790(+)